MQKYMNLTDFLSDLPAAKRQQVDALRAIIVAAEPLLTEHIKWNAPSYIFDGEDRITFNVMNKQGLVKLVLHMGATRKEDTKGTPVLRDTSGLIEWSSDIRGMITFTSVADIQSKQSQLEIIIKNWLEIPVTV